MQPKKKSCDGCREPKFIWKNQGGKRYCKQCWSALSVTTKPKPTAKQKRIPPRSLKRSKQEAEYSQKRKIYLDKHPMCEAHIPNVCTGKATEVHHKYSGKDRDSFFIDDTTWMAICRQCHTWIHNNSKKARDMDYLK